MGLTVAEGTTSLISKESWTVSADLKESAIAVTKAYGSFGVPKERFTNLKVTLAAQKGKRDLFTKGDIVPGIALEGRQGWAFYSMKLGCGPCRGRFAAVYLSGSVEAANRKIAQREASGIFSLREETGTTGSIGLGAEFAPSICHTLGLQVAPQWSRRIPVAKTTQQVCVTRQVGIDEKGNPVVVSDCTERFVGPLADRRGLAVRMDYRGPRWPNTAKTPADLGATVSILGAVSMAAIDGQRPQYNVALGPGVFAPNSQKLVGALLLELNDVTNTTGQVPHLSDQLSMRAYVGLPWGSK